MAKVKKAPVKKTAQAKKSQKIVKAASKKTAVKKKKPAKKKKAVAKPVKKAAKKTKSRRRKPETLMCFLTTACVRHYGLADDGYELTTLRTYRDGYLAQSSGGEALIKDYYRISPEIVKRVDKDKEKNSLYAYIYTQVKSACNKIEHQHLRSAKEIYLTMVQTLMTRYQLT